MVSHSVGMASEEHSDTANMRNINMPSNNTYMYPRSHTNSNMPLDDCAMMDIQVNTNTSFPLADGNARGPHQVQYQRSDPSLGRKWAPKRAHEDDTQGNGFAVKEPMLVHLENPRYQFSSNAVGPGQHISTGIQEFQGTTASEYIHGGNMPGFTMSLPCTKRQKVNNFGNDL